MFSGAQFFDVLNIGLFEIYVFMDQSNGEMRIRRILNQTPLGASLGVGVQTLHQAPGDLGVK